MLEIDLIGEAEKRLGKTLEQHFGKRLGWLLRGSYRRTIEFNSPPRSDANMMPNSWFGGKPPLPADIPWPTYHRGGAEFPMSFIMQLDCADLPRLDEYFFPASGVLLFFFEFNFQQERSSGEQHLGGKVIYLDDINGVPYREMPSVPDVPAEKLEFISEITEADWARGGARVEAAFPVFRLECGILGNIVDVPCDYSSWPREVRKQYTKETIELLKIFDGIVSDSFSLGYYHSHRIFGKKNSYAAQKRKDAICVLQVYQQPAFLFMNDIIIYYITEENLRNMNFDECFVSEGT